MAPAASNGHVPMTSCDTKGQGRVADILARKYPENCWRKEMEAWFPRTTNKK